MRRLIASIALIFLVFCCGAAFANSGPVFWQGYPSSEIMSIVGDRPIEVKKKILFLIFLMMALDLRLMVSVTAT